MKTSRSVRLLAGQMHTTDLPGSVVHEVIRLLETGTVLERMRAAQLLATAYAEDEERRLAGPEFSEREAESAAVLPEQTEPGD